MISIAVTPDLTLVEGKLLQSGKPFELRDTNDLKEFVIGTMAYVTSVLAVAIPGDVTLPVYEGRTDKGSASGDYCWAALEFLHRDGPDSQEFGKRVLYWAHLARLVVMLSPTLGVSPEGVAVLDFLTSSAARSALCRTRQVFEEILEWKRWRDSQEGLIASLTGEGMRERPKYPTWSLALPWPEDIGVKLDPSVSRQEMLVSICSDVLVNNGVVSFPFMCAVVTMGAVEDWLKGWMSHVEGDDVFVDSCFRVGNDYLIRATKTRADRGEFYCFRVLPQQLPSMASFEQLFADKISTRDLMGGPKVMG